MTRIEAVRYDISDDGAAATMFDEAMSLGQDTWADTSLLIAPR